MSKIPVEKLKQIPPKRLLKLINKAKEYLKGNEVMQEMCKEFGVDIDVIDLIPVRFGDLDVSAQTRKGVVILNYKLLADGDFFKDLQYLIHEFKHYISQVYGKKPTPGADDGEYLDNPEEQEGFQWQLQYIEDQFGKDEAEDYVENLLDHHDIDNDDEREEKKDILMERVEDEE